VFWKGVQHHLWFCLDHLSCVKMAAFQFYLQSWKQRKVPGGQVRWVGWGTTVMLFLVKNSLVEKEVRDGVLLWCNSQFFCLQSSGRRLCTFSRSHCKTSQ
jgi:hypothetical protein